MKRFKKLKVLNDFFTDYIKTFKHFWQIRKQLDSPIKKKDELEFLPDHLELIETAVSPLPKYSARLIVLLIIIVLVWSILGKLDILVLANGKISLIR